MATRTVQSVERAAAILQLLADTAEPMRLGDLAAALGLPKGTVHGLVATLREAGFVDQDAGTGRYSAAAALLHLGAVALDVNELKARALNWTDALARHTGEAALVARLDDGEVRIVHDVFRPRGDGHTVQSGSTRPRHATALGKVLLAHDPSAARVLGGGSLDSFTSCTVVEPPLLHRALADVRDLGWAGEVEEWKPGRASLAAPVRDRSGFVVAAVGIEGSVDDLCDQGRLIRQRLAARVVDAGRAVSRELGHGRRW